VPVVVLLTRASLGSPSLKVELMVLLARLDRSPCQEIMVNSFGWIFVNTVTRVLDHNVLGYFSYTKKVFYETRRIVYTNADFLR
jgi:hypothetical protein